MTDEADFKQTFRAMGTVCSLRWPARESAADTALAARVVGHVEALEQRYSRYRPDSECSRINAAAGNGVWVEIDPQTVGLLEYAAAVWTHSGGDFDLTAGVLRRAWNRQSVSVPTAETIEALLPLVGWPQVQREGNRVRLPLAGMELDFGGLVKEYAVDACVALCREAGLSSGVIELGGDIGVIGPHPDGRPWRVGIQHPRALQTAIAAVDLYRGGIASSGDYARSLEIAGQRYGHILHPRSGWPVKVWASISVLAPSCLVAGTAATVAMLKEEAAPDWLATLGLPWLGVRCDGRLEGTLKPGADGALAPSHEEAASLRVG